jgi:hypothetical protein
MIFLTGVVLRPHVLQVLVAALVFWLAVATWVATKVGRFLREEERLFGFSVPVWMRRK